MSYREERERTIARLMAAGWNYYDADKLHARANTAQRLAEAMCNGDYPADNGERETDQCPRCGGGWAPRSFVRGSHGVRVCPDCRNDEKIAALLPDGWTFSTAGDPRGCVLRVAPPGVNVREVNGDEARQVIGVSSR